MNANSPYDQEPYDPSCPLKAWEGLACAVAKCPPRTNILFGTKSWDPGELERFHARVAWLRDHPSR
jgi:hypothetical protein